MSWGLLRRTDVGGVADQLADRAVGLLEFARLVVEAVPFGQKVLQVALEDSDSAPLPEVLAGFRADVRHDADVRQLEGLGPERAVADRRDGQSVAVTSVHAGDDATFEHGRLQKRVVHADVRALLDGVQADGTGVKRVGRVAHNVSHPSSVGGRCSALFGESGN